MPTSDSGFAVFGEGAVLSDSGDAALLVLASTAAGTGVVSPDARLAPDGELVGVEELEDVGDVLGLVGLDANDDLPSSLGTQVEDVLRAFGCLDANHGGPTVTS
jgi:hypothetical protein